MLHIRTLSLARSMTSLSLCKLFIISTPICSETERDADKLTGFFQSFISLTSTQENSLSDLWGLSLQSCGQPGLITSKGFWANDITTYCQTSGCNRSPYSYFKKGCRKKCTRQSRKVLCVVLYSLSFKEIWKNGTRGHGRMFVSAKGRQQK